MFSLSKQKNFLYYAGASPDEYKRVLPEIYKYNYKRLFAFSLITLLFLGVMVGVSLVVDAAKANFWVYLAALVLTLAIFIFTVKFTKKNNKLLTIAIYAFISVLFLLGILIGTVTFKDAQTTTFIAFLLTVPLLFALKPIDNIHLIIAFDALYITMVILMKDQQVVPKDIINGLLYGGVSIIVSSYTMKVMMENFIMRENLTVMAETDQLTTLKNRNCYERQIQRYPQIFQTSITCIYIDINGLHDLNNTQGHAAGDAMLKYIAREFQEAFGENDCYRMGGDEYLAFVLDMGEDELETKLQTFVHKVEGHNYHMAIGCATQTQEQINIDTLVKDAEKEMFNAKKRFYSQRMYNRRKSLLNQ